VLGWGDFRRCDATRDRLVELGADGFSQWMLDQPRVLVTDTTFRDAHQSLLATRVRSYDIIRVSDAYARLLPELFSVECWGGAICRCQSGRGIV
jgi:pyruvate carboxylase